jgi:hypothetical protein
MLERVPWARSSEQRLKIRQEKKAPIIDELIEKIKYNIMDKKIVPKSKLRQVISYFTLLIPHLKNDTKDPRVDWAIMSASVQSRPLALKSKKRLFFGSLHGG